MIHIGTRTQPWLAGYGGGDGGPAVVCGLGGGGEDPQGPAPAAGARGGGGGGGVAGEGVPAGEVHRLVEHAQWARVEAGHLAVDRERADGRVVARDAGGGD